MALPGPPPATPPVGHNRPAWPTVRLLVVDDSVDVASAELWDLGTTGVAEEPNGDGTTLLVAGFPSVESAWRAAAVLNDEWVATVEVVDGSDWLDAWREHFTPLRVGRVVITPGWKESPAADPVMAHVGAGDVLLPLDPGHSFGTGSHASTRLAMEELHVFAGRDVRMLDVGCGSGVLSLAAIGLGVADVVAIDIETNAVQTTGANAIRLGMGNRLRASATSVADLTDTFDLITANILAPVLIELAVAIDARLRPGGTLILSGLIEEQQAAVLAAYPSLELRAVRREPPWVCLSLHRPRA